DTAGKVAHDRNVAGRLRAACEAEEQGSDQQGDPVRGHGKLLENKSAASRFSGILSPPPEFELWVGALLWRGRIRLLLPLHELLEQLSRLLGRRRSAWRRGGEKGLEFVDRRLLRSLSGWRQRVLDRLCEVGERGRRRLTVALPRAGHGDDEEQRDESRDADGGGEARRDGHNAFLDSRPGSCMI